MVYTENSGLERMLACWGKLSTNKTAPHYHPLLCHMVDVAVVAQEMWRTVNPERDWIIKSDFDIANVDFSVGDFNSVERPSYRQQFRDCYDTAEMYAWLSGKHDEFKLLGGQGWPMPNRRLHKWIGRPYGIPEALQD